MKKIFYLLTILLVCACSQEENTQIGTRKKTFSDYGINLISRDKCRYIDLIYENPMFCYIYEQKDWGEEHTLNRFYDEWYFNTYFNGLPNINISYGGVLLYNKETKHQDLEYDIFTSDAVNSNNNYFTITSPYDEREIQVSPIPQITITKPDPTGQPYAPVIACDANNFVLEWNAVPENTNGVFILVRWYGHCTDDSTEDQYQGSFIQNADLVEDNGHCVLNPQLFDGIPESALINISIIRGSVETIENFEFFNNIHLPMTFGIMSRSNYNTIILTRL